MATLYTHQSTNVTKTWVLLTTFFVLVIGVGFVFSQAYGNSVILYIAVAISLIMNVGSYWYSDKLVLKMVRAKPVTLEEYMELWNIVENLSITAGLPMPKLYIVDDPSPNAFATGRDKEHAAVAVHTGLMAILNKTELEGVLAHELSHVGNRDTLVSTVVIVLVGFVTILSDFFLRTGRHFGGGGRDNKIQGIFLLAGFALSLLAPLFAMMIQLAISRKREFLADASGALLTRYPEGLASALEKISGAGIPSTTANHATAHLYIANPFAKGGAMNKLFMTHPPVVERIANLRDMAV
ncbi:MAG: zinc metalloprotease HtpX [Candidatus Lloydbacteria bacterium RIFCSPHIGHO2_02_FULL_50_13]|uniref:Protease HtpX homolog n=1 Tax=Candidatus Lloydbacteria bacterium RIFCSPHIGHO2_02_FULL_50_13 TaxID=1798661 RepID=A0A1G2D3M7_9BACT|nr:MAG: zinc metalloprotease HtpX [Candidatus Lloydbacteria bacterium RIFCSPHIGHO2_02_FULL_50_13]